MKHLETKLTFRERRAKEIEDLIKAKQEELDNLRNDVDVPIIELEDYTVEEKVAYFDKMYKLAASILDNIVNKGYKNDDNEQWIFEDGIVVLNTRNKKAFWEYYNKLD